MALDGRHTVPHGHALTRVWWKALRSSAMTCRLSREWCTWVRSTDGAARETREEALAAVEILAPYVHFDIPRIGQAYILFRARLAPPFTFGAGEETQEAALFSPADIPFSEVQFYSGSTYTALHKPATSATKEVMPHFSWRSAPQI